MKEGGGLKPWHEGEGHQFRRRSSCFGTTLAIDRLIPTPSRNRSEYAPRCPKHVQGEARREWRRKTKELLSMRVLGGADRASLERYCVWYAIGYETLQKLSAAEGAKVYTTQSGYPMLNPLIALWKQACEMMDKFDTEFG